MSISSRTPEGIPHRCPVCGKVAAVAPADPAGDACCPSCGQLLWWFRDRLNENTGLKPENITLSSALSDLNADSLDTVELLLELEEEFDIDIPADVAERIETVGDAMRYLAQHRGDKSP